MPKLKIISNNKVRANRENAEILFKSCSKIRGLGSQN